MKRTIFYFFASLALLTSCQQEDTLDETTGYGYLSFTDISVQVANVNNINTRSLVEDLSLRGEIRQDGETVRTLTQEDLLGGSIRQKTGNYTIIIYSGSYLEYAGWTDDEPGEAVYYAETTVTIAEGEENKVTVKLPMINFGVCLSLPEGFLTWFTDYTFTVGDGNRTVALTDGQTAYFPYAEDAKITYTLHATNTDGEEMGGETVDYGTGEDESIRPNTIYTVDYSMAVQSNLSAIIVSPSDTSNNGQAYLSFASMDCGAP